MAQVDLQIVREFFELCVFRVMTNWQQAPWRDAPADHSPQLLVENTQPLPMGPIPFELAAEDIPGLHRAVVHVRAWHGDRFYPSAIESSPVLSRFEADAAQSIAARLFQDGAYATLLVLSELPVAANLRLRSMELLQKAGVDHILTFPVLLRELLERVQVQGNYAGSTTLETLRLLKRYKLIRHQQLEFGFLTEPPAPRRAPQVETQPEEETQREDAEKDDSSEAMA